MLGINSWIFRFNFYSRDFFARSNFAAVFCVDKTPPVRRAARSTVPFFHKEGECPGTDKVPLHRAPKNSTEFFGWFSEGCLKGGVGQFVITAIFILRQ